MFQDIVDDSLEASHWNATDLRENESEARRSDTEFSSGAEHWHGMLSKGATLKPRTNTYTHTHTAYHFPGRSMIDNGVPLSNIIEMIPKAALQIVRGYSNDVAIYLDIIPQRMRQSGKESAVGREASTITPSAA